jgi:excisionase family DNA binding protein
MAPKPTVPASGLLAGGPAETRASDRHPRGRRDGGHASDRRPAIPAASLTRDEVMLAPEVAELLRVPPSTVYDLARRGALPGHRVGRTWRFIRREVETWLLSA